MEDGQVNDDDSYVFEVVVKVANQRHHAADTRSFKVKTTHNEFSAHNVNIAAFTAKGLAPASCGVISPTEEASYEKPKKRLLDV